MKTKKRAVRRTLAERAKVPRNWNGALIHKEREIRGTEVQAMAGDGSLRPADSPVLWKVGVVISYAADSESYYYDKKSKPIPTVVDGEDRVALQITFDHARGSQEPAREFVLRCEMAHLDLLAEALKAALTIGRRDGTLPIARGIRPISLGERGK